jgi:hypothetical protein
MPLNQLHGELGQILIQKFDSDFSTIQKTSKQISLAKKEDGEIETIAFIMGIINEMSSMAPTDMSADQKAQAAKFISENYWDLRTGDLISCFKKIVSGHYGKIYHKITLSYICECLNIYSESKANYFEQQKPKTDWRDMDEKLFKGIKFEANRNKIEKASNAINNSEVQDLIREFNRLAQKQDIDGDGRFNFVKYENQILDLTEFLKLRLKK